MLPHCVSTFSKPFASVLTSALCCLALVGCSRSPSPLATPQQESRPTKTNPAAPWFEEVALKANLSFRHSSGHKTRYYMPEMVTGGVGLLDFDNDGLLDIYCVNGGSLDPFATNGQGNKLYHNLGNWKFEDVTERAGVGDHGNYGMGCACGDYNRDGWIDIYVTNLGRNALYRNNGDGTFTDVSEEAAVECNSWSTSAAFFDYDGDGLPDLVVVNYLKWSKETELNCFSRGSQPDYCSPVNYMAPAVDTLYHNEGNGTFANVTVPAGLDKAYGNGLGVVCADFDKDGMIDIYVANDGMPNQLWINQGNGKFSNQAMLRGCAVNSLGMPRAGMGVAAVDLNQRGWLDLFVTHLIGEGNGLFVNTSGNFTDSVSPKGPGASSLPYTGFGLGFADFDNDGELDLYVANGRVKLGATDVDPLDPYAEPNNLLRGLGNGQFEEIMPQGGGDRPLIATSRGLAIGDLDNDGGMDIVIINRDGPVHLLRNVVPTRGHWVILKVLDQHNCYAINAIVQIEAGGKTYWRYVIPNESYCSSIDPRIHCGLGKAQQVDRIVIQWPNGTQESFGTVPADRLIEVREGSGER